MALVIKVETVLEVITELRNKINDLQNYIETQMHIATMNELHSKSDYCINGETK